MNYVQIIFNQISTYTTSDILVYDNLYIATDPFATTSKQEVYITELQIMDGFYDGVTSVSSVRHTPNPTSRKYGPYTVETKGTATLGYTQTKSELEVLQVPYGYMFVAESSNFVIEHCEGHKDAQMVSFEQWSNCVMCGDTIYASTVEVSYQAHSPRGLCNAGKIGKLTWTAVLPLVERTDECKDWDYPCPDWSDKKTIAC